MTDMETMMMRSLVQLHQAAQRRKLTALEQAQLEALEVNLRQYAAEVERELNPKPPARFKGTGHVE